MKLSMAHILFFSPAPGAIPIYELFLSNKLVKLYSSSRGIGILKFLSIESNLIKSKRSNKSSK